MVKLVFRNCLLFWNLNQIWNKWPLWGDGVGEEELCRCRSHFMIRIFAAGITIFRSNPLSWSTRPKIKDSRKCIVEFKKLLKTGVSGSKAIENRCHIICFQNTVNPMKIDLSKSLKYICICSIKCHNNFQVDVKLKPDL